MHSCRGGWEGEKRWWKGDTGVVELGGFGGSREVGRDALRDLGQVSVGWTGQWGHPPGPQLASWGMSSDSQAAQGLSAEPWGLQPLPWGPALLGLHSIQLSSPISSLFHSSDLCPSSALAWLPLPLCCPLSQSGPALCRPPASHHLDQMGRCQRPMGKTSPTAQCPQSPVSSRVGTAPVGTLCPGSPAKSVQADRGPSPP